MNTLYHGDNLAILREMPDESVDLICTDPPFNTGKDWGAFNDKWEGGLKGYLKFMEPRCVEMRRVLKDTGSLYLHCDPTASHYLKVMLDGVFGIKQFRNEIVWSYRKWVSKQRNYQKSHNLILFYTKTPEYIWNQLYEPKSPKSTLYKQHRVINPRTGKRNSIANKNVITKDTMIRNVFDISVVAGTAKERLGYPTQKPVALYQRMIKASSNQHDTVLDPFAGSGTTLDAAQSLGRHWIGIDIGDTAIETIIDRMRNQHGLEYDRDYTIRKSPCQQL